jgi:hypothetical protein
MTTTNFAEFGYREKEMAEELLREMRLQGLPEDFYDDEVTVMFNKFSGYVFLINSDYQVAMMNGDKLESYYTLPYSGEEGFLEDILELDLDHDEDKEYIKDIQK